MAVIAIGDFEKENIVSLIEEHFSSLTNPTQARPREEFSVPLTSKDSVHFVTDTEETSTSLQVLFNHKAKLFKTQGYFRDEVILSMYLYLLNVRLYEVSLQKDSPFVAAEIYVNQLTPKNTEYVLVFNPLNNDFERGFEAILTEINRVRQHGFLNSELERIKDDYLSYYQEMYDNRDDLDSAFLIEAFIASVVSKETITSIVFDYELIKFSETHVKVPHVGFNEIVNNTTKELNECYFTHSYFLPVNKIDDLNTSFGITNYGCDFISMIETKNCLASQFHPEKSSFGGDFFIEKIKKLMKC